MITGERERRERERSQDTQEAEYGTELKKKKEETG